jgi:hypothetical protein
MSALAITVCIVLVAFILLAGGIYVEQQDMSADDSMLDSTRPRLSPSDSPACSSMECGERGHARWVDSPAGQRVDSPLHQPIPASSLRRGERIALSHPEADVKRLLITRLPHSLPIVKRTGSE